MSNDEKTAAEAEAERQREMDFPIMTHTTEIVSSYVGRHHVHPNDLGSLIAEVAKGLAAIVKPVPEKPTVAAPIPAVPVTKSVTADYLICLDDGKKLKSLKRHLNGLGMTPDEYRAKWGLPRTYPMVAPGYAARRSELAKAMGLGKKQANG